MKILLLFFLLFLMTLGLAANEAKKNNPFLSAGNSLVNKHGKLLSQEWRDRIVDLPAINAGGEYSGMNYLYPATPYSEKFFSEKRGFKTDYTAHFEEYSKDSLIIWNQLSKYSEMSDFSEAGLTSQYHLTSTDIHHFFSHSTYGKQFLNGTKLLVGVGVGMMGVLMVAPRSITRWENDYADKARHNLSKAFSTPPVWDQDSWSINYVGHPYAGSIYYNAVRAQGATAPQSFIFSAFISTGWEYLYEGVAERPSIQDLVVTPVVGSVLGELTHQATLKMKKNGCNFFEKVFILVLNPAHLVFKGYHQ